MYLLLEYYINEDRCMNYTAIDVARYVVNKCTLDHHSISNLQLQKILYYIQKDFLQSNLIAFDDDFEAWRFGPVIPVVYNKYCGYGGMPIRLLNTRDLLDQNYKDIIDPIIIEKRVMNPWRLVEETHEPGKAWAEIYKDGLGNHRVIPKELIRIKG